MIVGVLTTCHTQYTWDRSIYFFLFNRATLQILLHTLQVLYMFTLCDSTTINTIIEYVPNCFCSMSAVMVSMAVLIHTFNCGIHTHPVSWNCAYHLRIELSDGGGFPNLVRNCRWTIVARQSFWITLYYSNNVKEISCCLRGQLYMKPLWITVWRWL